MLYIVPNVYQLIQIISLYYISGDPISHNIAKITTFRLETSCPRQLKLLEIGIFPKNAKIPMECAFQLKYFYKIIVIVLNKPIFLVKLLKSLIHFWN